MNPRQEGHNAPEPGHRASKGVVGALQHEEATWELEDAMRLAHPFLFNPAEH